MVWGSFLIAAAALKHPREMVITPKAATLITQAECVIRIHVAAPQEYVKIDSTPRVKANTFPPPTAVTA